MDDSDLLETAADRWFNPLLTSYGTPDKVPLEFYDKLEPNPAVRNTLLGMVQPHVRFVQEYLKKYGEIPMPPEEDMNDMTWWRRRKCG